ncbi:MAG: sigma-54 dependent transcriptional regulator [Ignavibacteriales bacterium]|nr:sigma-54-dependent Fis family transcriptional regulator [Ignavibacterium sp.]MCO6447740.1 sigma-54-dependent Fis family transcriptional regulator [Ignavibacterium album]MCZ2269078.1 sigma-54 dependent transcriptional regulator [Ignavibacteriales bacterium]HMN17701.1 sigma-54 dependent transcriptional regulator [Ignavibacteriaceae bacterium]HOJ07989.1 sigma-54 dependent transcriptional regulator [Ignavibacteriaceae bacterium]
MKETILLVDDELAYLDLLKSILNQEGYSNVITESNPLNVKGLLKTQKIDLILLDIYMPQMSGLQLLEQITPEYPNIPVIVVTAVDDKDIALEAIKFGAYEFIIKPPDTDRLLLTIRRAIGYKLLERERDVLRGDAPVTTVDENKFSNIITDSDAMRKVFNLVEIFAPTNETILIVGETGTGKDLIAKKIHDLSPRKNKPYVAVNLASISHSLFESELFGNLKGSFTGSTNDKTGYFEAANGGSIFLDEIGELPKELQGKLLRAIQYNEIFKIGSSNPVKLDIRIIAATNRDLVDAVNKGNFRADLYYRLNRGHISLPPLRKRGNDVILLSNNLIKVANKTYNKNVLGLTREAIAQLRNYPFPGNVRELENIIFNSVVQSEDNQRLAMVEIPRVTEIVENELKKSEILVSLEEAEKKHIINVMGILNNNVRKAASILGVSERTLQRRLKKIRED